MESLLKNLETHATCPICLNAFNEPKTIVCLHTFCCDCLKGYVQRSQRDGQFRCPECQAEIAVPESFDKLPTGFIQNDLLDLLAVQKCCDGRNDITCANCATRSYEASFCFNCGKFLCPDCVNAHEILRNVAFKEHRLTLVKHFKREDYESLLKRPSLCSQKYHEQEVTRFFCLECQTCACQICIATGHENHTINALDKAAECEKDNFTAEVELMKEKRKLFSDMIRQFEQTAHNLDTDIANAKRKVSQTAEQMIASIRQNERNIIFTIENIRASRTEELDSAKAKVKCLVQQVNRVVEFADLIQRSSSSNTVETYKIFKDRVELLNRTPVPVLSVCSSVKFVKNCFPGKFTLGFTTTVDATIEGLSQDFQAGVESKLMIFPVIKGEAQNQIHLSVAVEPSENVRSVMTCQQEDGNFLVKFTSKEAGTYNIKVTLKSKHNFQENCFIVQVKERQVQKVSELYLKERGETPATPHGIAVNEKGLIAVSDCKRHCILIFDNDGSYHRKIGSKGDSAGELNYPTGLAYLNNNELLVADFLNHRIQQFNVQTGTSVKTFGKDNLQNPVSLCIDGQGRIAVADCVQNKIQVFTKNGDPVFSFGSTKLDHPTGCIFHQNMFMVSDTYNNCLKIFSCSGIFLYEIGVKGKGEEHLVHPHGLCIEKCGDHYNILVCDSGNGRIVKFSVEGYFLHETVTKLQDPIAIATTPDNSVLVSDFQAQKICILQF